ncbi:putative FlgJ-related protein [Paenibacillus sp. DS2015]|uniref:glucosaminidase domain-containing protein n=1 Tax=Paenibacillus sp. DS2015 TaxID=3373917 RepID=UPI003D20DE70
MNNNEFILKMAAYAIEDYRNCGVPASLTIAQAALESAWGESGLTNKANNLFGIKGKGTVGDKLISIMDTHNLYQYDLKNNEDSAGKEQEEDMTVVQIAQLIKMIEEQNKRITAMERRLNMSGQEAYLSHYTDAVMAAKRANAITTSADKSKLELNMIQMIYNMGLFDPGVLTMIKNNMKGGK